MKTSRTGRCSAGLTLALAGAVLVVLGPMARAATPIAPAQKTQDASLPQAATVKIDRAMLQERIVGEDGTVSIETYLDAKPIQSAKASPPVTARPQAAPKA